MFFFFNDTATTEIYTLSLHDALPICLRLLGDLLLQVVGVVADLRADDVPVDRGGALGRRPVVERVRAVAARGDGGQDRKSTRLNSSHANISYAVFCLKKKKKKLNLLP